MDQLELDENSYILKKSQSLQSAGSPTGVSEATDITSDTYQLVDDDPDENKDGDGMRSTIPMASFNYINSIIGSGIIGMPFALKQAGFGLGIILIMLVAALTDYSLVLLIQSAHLSNTNTYQDLVYISFGRPGFYILTVLQFAYPFIAMISYNVIIGDTITKLVLRLGGDYLKGTVLGHREFIIAVCTLLITLPLSLYRNIAKLSKISFVSLIFVIFILGVMIGKGYEVTHNKMLEPTPNAWYFASSNFTGAIGIITFAYMCHHNSFLIYESLESPNQSKWNLVTHLSVLISMFCVLIFGVTGYSTFTGWTQGDVLENYCADDDLVNAARFAFAVMIMMTYPLECFVTREVLENSIFANRQPQTLWRHIAETVTIVIINAVLSMATDCLGIVLEFNGVIAATPLAFILPPLCYLKLQNDKILSLKNIPVILTCAFGILVFVIGLILTFVSIAGGISCSHGKEMPYCRSNWSINQTALSVGNGSSFMSSAAYISTTMETVITSFSNSTP